MTDCVSELDISLYIDNELPLNKRKNLEKHIAACPDCGKLLKELENSSKLFESLKSVEPLSDFEESIISESQRIREGCVAEKDLSLFLDGELQPKTTRAVKAHLARCENCKAKFEELNGVSRLFKAVDSKIPSLEMDRAILARAHEILGPSEKAVPRVVEAVTETAERSFFWGMARNVAAVAAAVIIAGLLINKSPMKIRYNFFSGYKYQPVEINTVEKVPVYYAGVIGPPNSTAISNSNVVSSLNNVLDSSRLLEDKVLVSGGSVKLTLEFGDISYLSSEDQARVISKDVGNIFGKLYGKYQIKDVTIWIKSKGIKDPIGVVSFDRYGNALDRDWLTIQKEEFGKV